MHPCQDVRQQCMANCPLTLRNLEPSCGIRIDGAQLSESVLEPQRAKSLDAWPLITWSESPVKRGNEPRQIVQTFKNNMKSGGTMEVQLRLRQRPSFEHSTVRITNIMRITCITIIMRITSIIAINGFLSFSQPSVLFTPETHSERITVLDMTL